MIILEKYETERDRYIENTIDSGLVRSVSFYKTSNNGRKVIKEWEQPLEDLGIRDVHKYVDILKKRGFVEVKSA